ncbi:MAG TPA: S9 family peptidase [Isosphaeraceae bacterium]|nr:S9 family peptidase [Isosphaeraceae bacterium]
MRWLAVFSVAIWGGLMGEASAQAQEHGAPANRHRVDAAAAARQPAPGTVTPAAIAFTPDGKALTYLKPESPESLTRVLWRVELANGSKPRVIARAPGEGDTDANVSKEEALRRERQRLTASGITQIARAAKADVSVIPLGGDLYLLRGDGPLERLTTTASPEIDPQLTADGRKVGFVRDGELFVLDLETKKERQLTEGAKDGLTHGLAEFIAQEELDRSSGFWWAPDGAKLAYQETDERNIPLYTITHQGSDSYSLETHRYPFAGAANANVRLGIVSAEGGKTRWLDIHEGSDEFYLARVMWENADTLLVQALSRDQKSLRLARIDVETGKRTLLVEDRSETWINLHDDLHVIESTGEILWSSERTGFRHLELRDRDGRLIRVLTSGDWCVDSPSSGRGYQGVATVDDKRREVWFWAAREGPTQTHLYRVALDGGAVEKITRGRGTHRTVVAADGEHFVDTFSSHRQPPVTTLCDRSGKAIERLDDAAADPRIEQFHLVPPELTEFKNRDGISLQGAYYAPRTQALGARAPLIVILYGGPQHQVVTDSWSLTADMTAQLLTERGLAVWKMDNRGSPRRGTAFEAAIYHHMGDVEVRDQADGVRFVAASRPDVETSRVGVTGGSYGGYMTLRCLTEAPEVFHAGVSVSPVTSWDGYDTGYTERYMGTPASNPHGYHDSSVLPHADKLQGALLLIHGMLDENVHFRHTARLTTALITARKPFDLLPLPDERHSSRREADRQYVAERLCDFFVMAFGHKE